MVHQWGQPLLSLAPRRFASAIHSNIGCNERTNQPRPYRALVIRSIAAMNVSRIAASVMGIARSQRAQAVRSKQMLLNNTHHLFGALGSKHRMRQAHG